jgi:hypothetical protein
MNPVEQFFDHLWADPLARQYYITMAIIAIPVARVLMRAGFKPFWAVLLAVPVIGFLLCTLLMALRKWPQQKAA